MVVLLFDIDGTLLHTGGAGLASLQAAMRGEFSVTAPLQINLSGRTDRGIANELFEAHGIENSAPNWHRFQSAYLQQLSAELPQRSGRVLPGVVQLLETLATHPDYVIGLLTGNIKAGADLKLDYYQLRHYFEFGGFGDHHVDRDQVAAEALESSRRHVSQEPTDVWVIGDTPLDIRCARSIGARVLAVATGTHARDELQRYEPDVLLDSLAELEPCVDSVLNRSSPKRRVQPPIF